jgi:Domain of unknown function (DUF4158)
VAAGKSSGKYAPNSRPERACAPCHRRGARRVFGRQFLAPSRCRGPYADPDELGSYVPAERTAREHRQRAARIARFRDADERDLARLEELLVVSALEHNSPLALLRTAALRLRERQLLRPALSTLERLVAAARARAERETHELRFDVYCREKGWLDPMGFLDRRETDVDDAWAHRSGARLVLCAARRRG